MLSAFVANLISGRLYQLRMRFHARYLNTRGKGAHPMAEYTSILYSAEERIARITLNRPEKRNALNTTLRNEIVDALRAAERDDDVSVVLIEGAGASFCSGYDITPGGPGRPTE